MELELIRVCQNSSKGADHIVLRPLTLKFSACLLDCTAETGNKTSSEDYLKETANSRTRTKREL